jgi:hypothetical protein
MGGVPLSYVAVAIAAAALSLGPDVRVMGTSLCPGPYRVLAELPGWNGMRVPARFHVVTSLAFAVVVAQRLGAWRRAGGSRWLPIALMAALAVEYAAPLHVMSTPPLLQEAKPRRRLRPVAGDAVHAALATLPGRGAYVELPLGDLDTEARYLFWNTRHFRPTVNGTSGFHPPAQDVFREILGAFPEGDAIPLLQALGVELVVAHRDMLFFDPDGTPEVRSGALAKVADTGEAAIYRVPGSRPLPRPPRRCCGRLPARVELAPGGRSAVLRLDAPRHVDALALLVHRLPASFPRRLRVEVLEPGPATLYEGAGWPLALPGLVHHAAGYELRVDVKRTVSALKVTVLEPPPAGPCPLHLIAYAEPPGAE